MLLLSIFRRFLPNPQSIDESKEILSESMVDIENIAHETLMAHGGDSKVNVYFEESYFPMKTYADVTFPPGVYEAFRIDIGEHCGKKLVVCSLSAAMFC